LVIDETENEITKEVEDVDEEEEEEEEVPEVHPVRSFHQLSEKEKMRIIQAEAIGLSPS
jgi:hypothetical protein